MKILSKESKVLGKNGSIYGVKDGTETNELNIEGKEYETSVIEIKDEEGNITKRKLWMRGILKVNLSEIFVDSRIIYGKREEDDMVKISGPTEDGDYICYYGTEAGVVIYEDLGKFIKRLAPGWRIPGEEEFDELVALFNGKDYDYETFPFDIDIKTGYFRGEGCYSGYGFAGTDYSMFFTSGNLDSIGFEVGDDGKIGMGNRMTHTGGPVYLPIKLVKDLPLEE